MIVDCGCVSSRKQVVARGYARADAGLRTNGFTQSVCRCAMDELHIEAMSMQRVYAPDAKWPKRWDNIYYETPAGVCAVTVNEVKHFDTPWAWFIDAELCA